MMDDHSPNVLFGNVSTCAKDGQEIRGQRVLTIDHGNSLQQAMPPFMAIIL